MVKFTCKELGLDCDFVTSGAARVDVMQAAMMHAITVHAEITTRFSMDESVAFLRALEAVVEPELIVMLPGLEAVHPIVLQTEDIPV